MTAEALPLFFRFVEPLDRYLVTNAAGAFAFLNSREQLEGVICGDLSRLSIGQVQDLLSKNFLAPLEEQADRLHLIASRFASLLAINLAPPGLFMIVPTLRCDHDCRYCQVSRVPRDRKGYDLDEGHVDRIISLIDHVSGPLPKIEFQGGEPLLAFSFVRRFVEAAEKKLWPKSPSFVICSALGPLSDEMLDWAKGRSVDFSVSLDGPEIVHDRNRPSPFFPSFQTTVENIQRIEEALGPGSANCLATVTRTSLDFSHEIVETYFDFGRSSIFLRPLNPFGFAARKMSEIGYSAEEYFAFYRAVLGEVIRRNRERLFVDETALIHLKKIFRAGSNAFVDLKSPAGHIFGSLLINYDGRIFGSDEARMLWETTTAPELVMGVIGDDHHSIFENPSNAALLADTFLCSTPGCDECAYQPYCGAEPLHHLATQGDHTGHKALSFFCSLERKIFDHLFFLYESDSEAREVFDRWLRL